MSMKGMMQTVLVTELKQIQPDISDAALQYVLSEFSQILDVREILAAEIEALRRDKSDLLAYFLDAEKWFNKHDPSGYVSPKRENAQHRLRERDAEKGRAGFVAGAYAYERSKFFAEPFDLSGAADQYAEQVRRGEVE